MCIEDKKEVPEKAPPRLSKIFYIFILKLLIPEIQFLHLNLIPERSRNFGNT
jgi:hypothetical protein